MQIICSPSGLIALRRPGQGVGDLEKAGFTNISLDISLCCSGGELERAGRLSDGLEKEKSPVSPGTAAHERRRLPEIPPVSVVPSALHAHFDPLLAACRDRLSLPVARAPRLLWDTKRADLNGLLREITLEAIRLCGRVRCGAIIVPPLFSGVSHGEEWDVNRDFYLSLLPVARENHVKILLENQCRSMGGHPVRGICADALEAASWVDGLNELAGGEHFGFCMDAGVCSLCGQDMREYALTLGSRLDVVILRDCTGQEEASLLPFTCVHQGQPRTDWLGLIRGLRESGFDGVLLLDLSDTAAGFSPLLRPQLLSLARAVAEYFRWQVGMEGALQKYRSVVLFGAGNMCRNYMKCYGEKYPPLFTCDNNRAAWGSSFCGLKVRPPEALLELPDDCGVFICNIYYREIEKQLREMGIKNIEFFNDEYMPSFYFDRLKGV